MPITRSKVAGNKEPEIIPSEEGSPSIPEDILPSENTQNTIIQKIEYRETKSVFNYKNFRLDVTNFERWYSALKRHLIAQDYQDYIEKEFTYDNMTRIQIKLDNAVQSIIVDSLDVETQSLLRGCKTSYEMITILKQQFYKSGQDLVNHLMTKIKSLVIKNNNYSLYLNELSTLFYQYDYECQKLGVNILDEQSKLIYSCSELRKAGFTAFNTFKYTKFDDLKEDLLKAYYHQKRLEEYESTRNISSAESNEENTINYISNKSNKNYNKNRNNTIIDKNNNKFFKNEYCYICHKSGHSTDNCNFNQLNTNKTNKYQNSANNNNNKRNNKINNNYSKGKNKYRTNSIMNNNNILTNNDKEDYTNDYLNFVGNVINTNNKNTNKLNIDNSTHWIIDSGTAINLSNDINNLNNITNVNNKSIVYPNGVIDKINCKGVYNGHLNNSPFILSNVHYSPNLKNNLVSTHHFLQNKCKIIMDNFNNKERLRIFNKDNKLVANIYADNENLFSFNTKSNYFNQNNHIKYSNKNKELKSISVNFIDNNLWHSRLGHFCNVKDIKSFVNEHTKLHNKKECQQCKISKMKKQPFYSTEDTTTEPFQLVHSDVVGKLQNSYQGYSYYVTFLDDFTRKCWVFLLKNKNEVPQKFINFHKLAKNVYKYNITTLKSDNGTEYINSTLKDYLNNNGIKFIHSIPGNPQQNGKAERLNQTLNNCAKTLINAANLSFKFWDSAIATAAYLYNHCPHSAINFKIPNELFFHKPVDISHLKVFGCRVYFFNNHKSNKFENNSKPGIFLGYSNNSTGYRVLDISTKSIITVRDAYFIEDIPGTLQTPLFSSKIIDSFFDTSNLPIEGEVVNNNKNNNQLINSSNNNNNTINNNNNNNNNENNINNNENITDNNSSNNYENNKNNINDNTHENIIEDDVISISSYNSDNEPLNIRKLKLNENTNTNNINNNKVFHIKINTPLTYQQAINSKDSDEWKIAFNKELNNMYNKNVMKIVDINKLPKNIKLIGTRWVLTTKSNGTKKARIVVQGCQQKLNDTYSNTYAPTAQADTLRITIAVAAIRKWNIKQLDIQAAYLNAKLKEKIYVKVPEGDKNYQNGKAWLLQKALYGLKQAGRVWNQDISTFLKSIGLKQYRTDKCLFGKYNEQNKLTALLTLYVDDILITGENTEIKYIINKLKNKYEISMESDATKIVGINIYKTKNGYKINQNDFINKTIEKYNMNKSKTIKYPCRKISDYERKNSKPIDINVYKSLLGSLLYISVKTRPDIAFAVNQASRYAEAPTEIDYKSLLTILQYLKSTKDKSIYYNGDNQLVGFSDADFANDESTRKSTSGFIYLLGNSPISWKSQLQRNITLSTAEAEFVSLTECSKHGIWLKNLFEEITNKKVLIKIKVDNKACIAIAEDQNAKGRCKHIDLRYKYIRENMIQNKIELEYVSTNNMLADPLTKPVSGIIMSKFNEYIYNNN